jgi:hypothetical protein
VNVSVTTINGVGFCPHYSKQGDWAFEYALRLARFYQVKLNVFHFLSDPYDPLDRRAETLSAAQRERLAIEREKEARLYYDSRAGDYLNVGFRLCEHTEWFELHRCLVIREFQVLVLGHPFKGVTFGGRPLEEFTDAFVAPVVLVGPERPDEFFLNRPAQLIIEKLLLDPLRWSPMEQIPMPQVG